MSPVSSATVQDAVVLAAGNGDRFTNPHHHSKLLHPVLGQPLILRTLENAAAGGLSFIHVVLGFEAERVREAIQQHRLPGVSIDFVVNDEWHLENGVSALKARPLCGDRRFALLMGDHFFEPAVLHGLVRHPVAVADSVLAIDTRTTDPAVVAEATKVRLVNDRIVAIGKRISPWHALDTGLFVFTPALFEALEEARQAGDTTLSAGVQRLADRGLMRGVDIGSASWCDVDTVADLNAAESLFALAEAERT